MEKMRSIKIGELVPSKTNPRKTFDKVQMDELITSIKEKGVVQPILVRETPSVIGFEIVTGERRYRAAQAAGLKEIPAMIRDLTDQDVMEIQVIENLHRANVHPLEEAEGYALLNRRPATTVASIANKIGQSEKYVYDRLKLLALIPAAREFFLKDKFTIGHAIILARLTRADQTSCLDRNNGGMFQSESYSLMFTDGDSIKCRSTKELQGWIDLHVRFDREKVDQMIFPETAAVVKEAQKKAEKIVPITEDWHIQDSARTDEKIISPRSWKRADGKAKSKTCEFSVTGVFVVGKGRGEAMKVCTAKEKCKIHWGEWQKERAARQKGTGSKDHIKAAERQKKEEAKRQQDQLKEELWRKRWQTARPELCKKLATLIAKTPAGATSILANIIMEAANVSPKTKYLMTCGTTAEDFIRYVAHAILVDKSERNWDREEFVKTSKILGLDANKMVSELVPEGTMPKEEKSKKGVCRKCGCTHNTPCQGGCSWTDKTETLCTACEE